MTPRELLAYLRHQGVEVSSAGGRLRVNSPKGAMTEELREALKQHKPELLGLLNGKTTAPVALEPDLTAPSYDGAHPLSYAQERFWFLHELDPDAATYNVFTALRIDGALDSDALERALKQVVERHAIFRTRCLNEDGRPGQHIDPHAGPEWRVTDLRHLGAAERETEVQALVGSAARRPFDLARNPLLRAELLVLAARDQVLLLSTHHFAADGWSMQILGRELFAVYAAVATGQDARLPAVPLQYVDYARWQRRRLDGERRETLLSYWTEQLRAAPSLLHLPSDRPRPFTQSHRGAQFRFKWPAELCEGLRRFSREHSVTVFTSLLTAFQVLLHRYSGDDDVLVGVPVSDRGRTEFESVIGQFGNNVVCRARFDDNPSFTELLRRTREAAVGAFAHQDLPFELLLEALKPDRDPGYSPMFQATFVLHQLLNAEGESADLRAREMKIDSGGAMFDISLDMTDQGGALRGSLEYSTDLFDRSSAERMLNSMQTLLEAAIADPARRVGELPLLSDAERRLIVEAWNDTATEAPAHATVPAWFEATAQRYPEATALVAGGERVSYSQLNGRANRLAHHLIERGAGPETVMGVCMERSVEQVVALLAVHKTGGAYLPLDPDLPAGRLDFLVRDTSLGLVLGTESHQDALPDFEGERVLVDRDRTRIEAQADDNPDGRTAPGHLAYVIYTSGSTGTPKGVEVTQAALVNHLDWMLTAFPLAPGDRMTLQHAFSFDVAALEVFMPLMAGAASVVVPPAHHFDVEELVELMVEEQITVIDVVPSVLDRMLENPRFHDCTHLRRVTCGGEVLPAELAGRCLDIHDLELANIYGPAEATIGATYWRCERGARDSTVPIGRPIFNTQVYLLDRHGQPVPIGVTGELHVGGAGVARGYRERPELTRERFIPDPFRRGPQARLYRTGDLGRYRPDGAVEFLGRVDEQVNINGLRVEPGEIEARLKEHPAIAGAVVLAEAGDGDRERRAGRTPDRLVAYIVSAAHRDLDEAQLREFLGSRLPSYMLPAAFVDVPGLPRLPSGKVDRERLRASQRALSASATPRVPPRNRTEQRLLEIWRAVLATDDIGIHDDFFAAGGHSLMATRLVSQVRTVFDIRIRLVEVFEAPTIARLAERVDNARWARSGLAAAQQAGSEDEDEGEI